MRSESRLVQTHSKSELYSVSRGNHNKRDSDQISHLNYCFWLRSRDQGYYTLVVRSWLYSSGSCPWPRCTLWHWFGGGPSPVWPFKPPGSIYVGRASSEPVPSRVSVITLQRLIVLANHSTLSISTSSSYSSIRPRGTQATTMSYTIPETMCTPWSGVQLGDKLGNNTSHWLNCKAAEEKKEMKSVINNWELGIGDW